MTRKEGWSDVPQPIKIIIYTVLGVAGAFVFGLLFGWIIVWLWNALMPVIFGLPTITFWQGVGLFILAKILFGGFSSHGSSSKSSKKRKKDWDSDTMKHKFESWKHYDEWWKSEGKESFEKFAGKADEEPEESAPEDEAEQPEK